MTRLPTLPTYLEAMQQLLAFILRIPPVDPSTSLRTTFLLRLTGDVMNSIPGYPPDIKDLPHLLDFLDDLDQAWLAVLRSQIWDAESGEGVDLVIPIDVIDSQNSAKNKGTVITSTPVNQTERTRLRSLLITGTASLEEWLTGLDTGGEDYQLALERAGIQQSFDDLFSLTLAEMGSFEGMMNIPAGMEGTC
ncbi:hypothetical protein BJ138DRAFT_1164679 [Hygrophoropsis aurantiaca]|uniref:Uncharacterized protein n=1 Tax=Hygrophoropsis aurantiaca TaxID=72124 RepID=A0ACB7ZXS3_9AGAM|nr:hypothetical protein BJ138DRAFT_1164679 [Hygrophoropsis aurantiaca]